MNFNLPSFSLPSLSLLVLILLPTATAFASRGETPPPTHWRWLGVKAVTSSPCPAPVGPWSAQPAFPSAPAGSTLADYCTFTFTDSRPVTVSDEDQLLALVPASLSELGRDTMALGSLGTSAPQSVWKPLAKFFREQAGAVQIPYLPGSAKVRLTVVDTHPTDDIAPLSLPANSDHGLTLLAMADQLLCNGELETHQSGDCIVTLASRLALSYVSYDADDPTSSVQDTVLGGYVGTISELAQAIYDEVDHWQAQASLQGFGQAPSLVLNLSVGWNPNFGGLEDDPADMPLPARMVYDAIEKARCEGALVVAAAGNRTGGPRSGEGPMMPAAWANRPAPTTEKCGGGGGAVVKNAGKSLQPGTTPFLYAAGGVQGTGHPLASARRHSLPERVAFGDHGVIETATGDPTAILTGSSVATLARSSSAMRRS